MPPHAASRRPRSCLPRTRPALLSALALALLPACASAPDGPPPEVDLAPEYHFSGMVAGRTIEGTLRFPAEGGYVIDSRSEICVHTKRADRWQLQAQLRTGSLRLQCGFDLRVRLVDGDLAREALATVVEVETYQVAGGCAARDENGTCIRTEVIDRTRRVSHEGHVRIDPVRSDAAAGGRRH